MSFFKTVTALGLLVLSSAAFARTPNQSTHGDPKPAVASHSNSARHANTSVRASVHLPAFSLSIGAPPYANALWVDGYHDHHNLWHAGYWRPHQRSGLVWIDGYRDRFGHWQAGYWARR